MHDKDLKNLLLETCPVRPGQEERAWSQLKDRLSPASRAGQSSFFLNWRGALAASLALVATALIIDNFVTMGSYSIPFASVNSQSPGIYATYFYSASAHAQVVWLNGMEPATDKLTYLDPTTVIAATPAPETPSPAANPNGP